MPAKTAAPKYPRPSRGSAMTLTIDGNALIQVPFRMAPMVPSGTGRLTAHTYCTEHRARIKSQAVCTEGGEVCDTFSAYDVDGKVIEVDKSDVGVAKDKALTLKALVDPASIDPLYFEKSYMVWADPGQELAFDQIASALKTSGKAAVGTAVMRDATKAIVLRWSELAKCLVAHVCTYDARVQWDEVAQIDAGVSLRAQPSEENSKAAAGLLEQSLGTDFDFGLVEDEYAIELEAVVMAAAAGVELPAREAEAAPAAPTGDILAALAAGLPAAQEKPAAKPRAKKAA